MIRDRDVLDRPDVAPPAKVANRLNRLFPFDLATEQFATLMYGVLDVSTGDFHHVSAGHPGPLHLPAGGPPEILESPGSPIGLADEPYGERCVHLEAGDRMYLYSDGLPDAMNPGGERFGESAPQRDDRPRTSPVRSGEGIATLLDQIAAWQGGQSPQDEISILAVEMSSTPDSGGPGVMVLGHRLTARQG